MKRLVPLLAGMVFGLGLAISGMTSPARVKAFLDVTGAWDPTLAFVMGGALTVAAPLFYWARRRGTTLEGHALPSGPAGPVDRRLIGGAALFGIGWGVAGLCPGPGLANLAIQPLHALAFVVPLIIGLLLSRRD